MKTSDARSITNVFLKLRCVKATAKAVGCNERSVYRALQITGTRVTANRVLPRREEFVEAYQRLGVVQHVAKLFGVDRKTVLRRVFGSDKPLGLQRAHGGHVAESIKPQKSRFDETENTPKPWRYRTGWDEASANERRGVGR